jgi:hypothetical protein
LITIFLKLGLPDNLFNVIADVVLISLLTIVPSTIFADVIMLSAISAEVKGTAEGLFPMKGIYIFLL